MPRPIVFLSDFGYRNEWVGICHSVIAASSPSARIVDLSHGVPPLDVRGGAILLQDSRRFLPANAVVLAVVDPSVGSDRDVALETEQGRLLVGPDNGLLGFLWAADGGVRRAHEITLERIILHPVAPSFHARDVLAPAAAFLAADGALEELGQALDPASLSTLPFPAATVEKGKIECEVPRPQPLRQRAVERHLERLLRSRLRSSPNGGGRRDRRLGDRTARLDVRRRRVR